MIIFETIRMNFGKNMLPSGGKIILPRTVSIYSAAAALASLFSVSSIDKILSANEQARPNSQK